VDLWDLATGKSLGTPLYGHIGLVNSIAFGTLTNGRVVLASGGQDANVGVWDPSTGKAIGDFLTGHISTVNAVAFWGPFRRTNCSCFGWG
jgi:WD40 repeat protein